MEYYNQFQKHLSHNNFPSFVSLWQEYCLCDEIDPKELSLILIGIKDSPFKDAFGCYVEEILPLWQSLPESPEADRALALVFDVQTTNSQKLAEIALDFLEKRYGREKGFLQGIKLVGLRDKVQFRGALSHFEVLHHMEVGSFFIHDGGWGVGEVVDVSQVREQVTLEFDCVAGKKELSFANAFKTLTPIPKTHFLAMRFGDADGLEKMAKENPTAVLRILLRDMGPKNASDIKDELADLVIPEAEWAKWWQNARAKIKKDTMIHTPSQLKDPFYLRSNELSHEERFIAALEKCSLPKDLLETLLSFSRDFPVVLKAPSIKAPLEEKLASTLIEKELSAGQEIVILFFLSDIDAQKYQEKLSDVISQVANPEKICSQIESAAYKKRFLLDVKKLRSGWAPIFLEVLFSTDQNPTRDFILETLLAEGYREDFIKKISELLHYPNLSSQTFLWYLQKVGSDKKGELPFTDVEGKNRFFESFFILLYQMEEGSANKEVVKKMTSFLTAGRYLFVREFLKNTTLSVAQEILLLATKCRSLTDSDIKILYSLVEVVHPSLKKKEAEVEEEVIWSTEEGLQKLKNKIQHLATVETVENAKEIESARSLGDLRENSEFKFALERRDRLQSEIRFLSGQLSMMRTLSAQDIDTTTVSVGTTVTLKDSEGSTLVYTFLGPWDADTDKNILSFQSKVATSLFGRKKGQTCELPDGIYTIERIDSYFNGK